MDVNVTTGAVFVPHEFFRRDITASRRCCEGWREVGLDLAAPGGRGFGKPGPCQAKTAREGDNCARAPADRRSRQSVQDKEPARGERRRDMQPVGDGAGGSPAQFDQRNAARQGDAGTDQQQHDREEREAEPDGQPVWTMDSAAQVQCGVDDRGQRDDESQGKVAEEHGLVKRPLQALAFVPLQQGNSAEVDRIDDQQREEHEHGDEQFA